MAIVNPVLTFKLKALIDANCKSQNAAADVLGLSTQRVSAILKKGAKESNLLELIGKFGVTNRKAVVYEFSDEDEATVIPSNKKSYRIKKTKINLF